MNHKQKQHLLGFLGWYTGSIDGIWGPESRKAACDFQKKHNLNQDPDFGPESQEAILKALAQWQQRDFWSGIRWFRREEFACRCGSCGGFPAEPEESLVELAEKVRQHFGKACTVSSGVRCPAHNARVAGVQNSRHLSGKAMDFCVSGKTAAQVLAYVRTLPVRYAYAIDKYYVHMDVE